MSMNMNKSNIKGAKHAYKVEVEEKKYKSYLQHVETLNKMKDHLASMHKAMGNDIVKRLVVSIKCMETDLSFYENNWHLFESPNLDYIPEFKENFDTKINLNEQQMIKSRAEQPKYKTMRPV